MKLAIRCFAFMLLAAIPLWPATNEPCTILVLVGEHKSVTVTIPCMSRHDLTDIVSTFFGRGDEAAKKRFDEVLKDSGDITLTITTQRR